MRSTAVTLMAFVVALSGGVARAGVIDGFEGGAGWTSNYTIVDSTGSSGTIASASTGNNGQAPFAGNELGMLGDGSIQRLASYIWDGPEQVSSGDTVSVMAYMDGDYFFGGVTLIVKKFNSTDAYMVALWRWGIRPSDPLADNLGFSVGVKDLTASIAGRAMKEWATNNYLGGPTHTAALANTILGSPASGWFKIEATYTEIGATNQIAVTIEDALGNPLGSATYTDSGSGAVAAQGAGDIGFGHQVWSNTADVDNFDYVPEPATLGLLGVGALALIRRRRA